MEEDSKYYEWGSDWDSLDKNQMFERDDRHIEEKSQEPKITYSSSLYDFFKYCLKFLKNTRYVCYITNKQICIGIGDDQANFDHLEIQKTLQNKMFPERNYFKDSLNGYEKAIGIYGYGYDTVIIALPKELSPQQYESLLNIIEDCRRFEREFDVKIRVEHFDDDLEKARQIVTNNVIYDSDEVIFGAPQDEKYLEEASRQETVLSEKRALVDSLLDNWDDDWDEDLEQENLNKNSHSR